jgi:hypothetical protein
MNFDSDLDYVQQHMIPLFDTPFVVCNTRHGPDMMGKTDICFQLLWPLASAFFCYPACAFCL